MSTVQYRQLWKNVNPRDGIFLPRDGGRVPFWGEMRYNTAKAGGRRAPAQSEKAVKQ